MSDPDPAREQPDMGETPMPRLPTEALAKEGGAGVSAVDPTLSLSRPETSVERERIEELYRRFSGWLRPRLHGRDAQFADDVVQDLFLEFCRSGGAEAKITKSEEARLAFLCRKRLIDAARSEQRRHRLEGASTPPMAEPEHSPFQEDFLAAAGDRLEQVLPMLPLRQQTLVFWRAFEECSFEEIGSRLQVPPKTAMSLWYRTVEELRRRLGR